MAVFITLLGFTLLAVRQVIFLPTFLGTGAVIAFLIVLKRTKRYELIAVLFSIIGTALCQLTLIYFTDEYHMVDSMWILVIVLYTFFMLGKVWGVVVLAVNTLGIGLFIAFVLNTNLRELEPLSNGHILGQIINFTICAILIAFLIFQFLNVIQIAENDFRQVNRELKDQNETIAVQNKEKTVMLREIHHRVKNNLQVITSLLRLQSDEIKDAQSKEKFDQTINRVISMALIHERMYQSENLSKIDLEGYLESLSKELIQSYNVQKNINLTVDCELQEVHPKSLVSLALIFNELISNSLKHAFAENDNSAIAIKMHFEGKQKVKLVYSDNGKWKPKKGNSFGMELMSSLSEQLGGNFEIDTTNGTRFEFTFDRKGLIDDE